MMQPSVKPPNQMDPLVVHLLVLTFSTGLVDALSLLSLGHVFTANMTGNIVFLGFALAGWPQFSSSLCGVALAGFLMGSSLASRLSAAVTPLDARQLILRAAAIEFGLQSTVLLFLLGGFPLDPLSPATFFSVAAMAAAMGARNAVARKLAVPDLTTTVLTLTLTGIAADSSLAGGANPRLLRRLAAVGAMFAGALLGALLLALHLQLAVLAVSVLFSLVSALFCAHRIQPQNPVS